MSGVPYLGDPQYFVSYYLFNAMDIIVVLYLHA
jgi:hypothetical protein